MILFAVAMVLAVVPELPNSIYNLILQMTVEKPTSDSGQQRLFWAMQGWHGMIASFGLGIGPGSFRSSSMIMAIIGSMGIIGIASFLMYMRAFFQPFRRSSWGEGSDLSNALGGGFASAAILCLIPASIGSPQANPSATFSILAGAALALRPALAAGKAAHLKRRKHRNEQPIAGARAGMTKLQSPVTSPLYRRGSTAWPGQANPMAGKSELGNSMKGHVLDPSNLSADLLARWKQLCDSNPLYQSPFYRPQFTQTVAIVRSDARVAVLEMDGDVVGFFPFHLTRGGTGKPIGGHINDYHGPIVSSGLELSGPGIIARRGHIRLRLQSSADSVHFPGCWRPHILDFAANGLVRGI